MQPVSRRARKITEGRWQSAQMLRLFAHIICYMCDMYAWLLCVCVCVCMCRQNVKWPSKLAITHTTRCAGVQVCVCAVVRSFAVRQFISGGLAHSSLAPSNKT